MHGRREAGQFPFRQQVCVNSAGGAGFDAAPQEL